MFSLSQVIYGVRNLDAATKRIKSLGLSIEDVARERDLTLENRSRRRPDGSTAHVPLRIIEGAPGLHRVGISTPCGVLVLP